MDLNGLPASSFVGRFGQHAFRVLQLVPASLGPASSEVPPLPPRPAPPAPRPPAPAPPLLAPPARVNVGAGSSALRAFARAIGIPHTHGLVVRTARDAAAVGAESDRIEALRVSAKEGDVTGAAQIPRSHEVVPASRDDPLAVGTYRDAIHVDVLGRKK